VNSLSTYKLKAESLYDKNKEVLPALFFFSGFFFDVLTLGRIDEFSNIFIQLIYLFLATYLLVLEFSGFKNKKQVNIIVFNIQKYHDEIFHFLLGSLLSAFALFFFKSASLANSFLFIFFFISLLVINEFEAFQKIGKLIRFLLLLLCFICYFLLIIPVMIGGVGPFIFIFSMVLSSSLLIVFYQFLKRKEIMPDIEAKRIILGPGLSMIFFFILFYFLQIIPPVPLSLEKIGIYHKVEKNYPEYSLHHERPWYRFWETGDQTFIARPGDKLYVFVSVFSPGGFKDSVNLHWMKDVGGTYKTSDKITMKIQGGRGKGFRGISFKSNYAVGKYRVKVETLSGLEIGRINLEVIQAAKEELTEVREFKIDIDR
jgi:hypothetical protein